MQIRFVFSLLLCSFILCSCDGCRDCEVEHFGEMVDLEVCKKDYDTKSEWKAYIDTLENRGGKCSNY